MKTNSQENPWKNAWKIGGVILMAAAAPSWSLTSWSYPGCANVTDSDFKYDTLVMYNKQPDPTLSEPDKIAFDMDTAGTVDVYFVEIRPGNIKKYSAKTKTVKTLVKLPNWTGDYLIVKNNNEIEEGVTGIAMDPNFKTNHWIYIHWSPAPASDTVFRISRFTVTPGGGATGGDTILASSEKVILEFPAQRNECCHTGGAMDFDAYGDLWIAQGANSGTKSVTTPPTEGINETKKYESEEWGASSTHGLRGGILRIHPLPFPDNQTPAMGVGGTYSIPSGNFGDYFAQQTGNNAYRDTSKVLPEIYIKGTRNAYSLSLDPVRRWVVWGDVGPDVWTSTVREEENLRQTPGFEGWPYYVGLDSTFSYHTGSPESKTAPTNTSVWNTGLTTLPPARPAFKLHNMIGTTTSNTVKSPITGPIYRYNGALSSTVKFPPHFNRLWFVTDHDANNATNSVFNVNTLDSAGTKVIDSQQIFTNHFFQGPVDFKAGPDGALYVVCYGNTNFATTAGTSIQKISYKQASKPCAPLTPTLEQPTALILNPNTQYVSSPSGWWVNLQSGAPVLVPEGMTAFRLFDLMGRKIWEIKDLRPGESFRLPVLHQGAFKYLWVRAVSD